MELLALFSPEELRPVWRVRLFPKPPFEVSGLSEDGEYIGLARPNFDTLDQLMLERRAGYQKRRHGNGFTEVSVQSPEAVEALCTWVALLIDAREGTAPRMSRVQPTASAEPRPRHLASVSPGPQRAAR